jgi:Ca-activated chloride channel family protein
MRLEGWSMRVQLDEPVLKEIARATHGEYFRARTAIDWPRIVNTVQPEPPRDDAYTEITALFAAVAALAAICCALMSLAWSKRVL